MKIFLDSDVVISSVISKRGAAHFILNESKNKKIISNYSVEEMTRVAKRGKVDEKGLSYFINKSLKIVKSKKSLKKIKKEYKKYIKDENDAHIVAGANQSKAKIVLTPFVFNELRSSFLIPFLFPSKFTNLSLNKE